MDKLLHLKQLLLWWLQAGTIGTVRPHTTSSSADQEHAQLSPASLLAPKGQHTAPCSKYTASLCLTHLHTYIHQAITH